MLIFHQTKIVLIIVLFVSIEVNLKVKFNIDNGEVDKSIYVRRVR